MAKTKEKPPRPTREELDRWHELEQKRLELARMSKNIGAEQEHIEEKALAFAQAEAGRARPAIVGVCGYQLEVVLKRASVQWKQHYIDLAGHEKAAELTAAAPQHDAIKIHAPAKA